jgi:uncharacterized protein (TIGR03435 family)
MRASGLSIVAVMCSVVGSAQVPAYQVKFDVASVKLAGSDSRFALDWTKGRINFRKLNLKGLVWMAYADLAKFQFDWPESLVGRLRDYDISATFPPDTSDDDVRLMLRDLLRERFGMVSHWTTRDLPIYALEVSKRGLRVQKSANPPPPEMITISHQITSDGWRLNDHLPDSRPGEPHGITMGKLTQYFNNNGIFDRQLVDRTSLNEYYEINMFVPADPPPLGNPLENSGNKPSTGLPDQDKMRDALLSQLGLAVTDQKAPMQVLVIDQLNTVPTGN